ARPSRGELDRTLSIQLDPYSVAPLWPDARGLAGLQAQAMRDSGRFGDVPDVPATTVADGAAALVLAVGDRAKALTKTPVWIRGSSGRDQQRRRSAGRRTCHQRSVPAAEPRRCAGGCRMSRRVAVVGVGQTKYAAKRQDVSMPGLVREAAKRALDDAGMTWSD